MGLVSFVLMEVFENGPIVDEFGKDTIIHERSIDMSSRDRNFAYRNHRYNGAFIRTYFLFKYRRVPILIEAY